MGRYDKVDPVLLSVLPREYVTEEMCLEAVRDDASNLRYVPKDLVTGGMLREAVERDGLSLRYAPKDKVTLDLCEVAIAQNPMAYAHVPSRFCSEEMERKVLAGDGRFLKLVPEGERGFEKCVAAVGGTSAALAYVPRVLQSAVMDVVENRRTQNEYLERVREGDCPLGLVPEKYRDEEMCDQALLKDPLSLADVPYEFRTSDRCMGAVKRDGLALEFVPPEHLSRQMCLRAVEDNGEALKFVPAAHKDVSMCQKAVGHDFNAIMYVPHTLQESMAAEYMRSDRMRHYVDLIERDTANLLKIPKHDMVGPLLEKAIDINPAALQWVPEEMQTPSLVNRAVLMDPGALAHAAPRLMNEKLCMRAVELDPLLLGKIPDGRKTEAMCRMAVEKCGSVLGCVPKEFRTPEICKTAVCNASYAIEYVPGEMMTRELVLDAVSGRGDVLGRVPEEFRTVEVCAQALRNGGSLREVPEDIREEVGRINADMYEVWLDEDLLDLVRKDGMVLGRIAAGMKADEFSKLISVAAVEQNPDAVRHVPEGHMASKLAELAVGRKPELIREIDPRFLTAEVCLEAVKKDWRMLEHVPFHLLDNRMGEAACAQNGAALKFIPKDRRDECICDLAVRNDPDGVAMRYVPMRHVSYVARARRDRMLRSVERFSDKVRTAVGVKKSQCAKLIGDLKDRMAACAERIATLKQGGFFSNLLHGKEKEAGIAAVEKRERSLEKRLARVVRASDEDGIRSLAERKVRFLNPVLGERRDREISREQMERRQQREMARSGERTRTVGLSM